MKKLIPMLALSLLCLTGCTEGYELPEGMDQDTVVAAGSEIVTQLNDGDFEDVWAQFRSDVQETTTAEQIQQLFDQVVTPEGEFEKITDTLATSDTDDNSDEFYAIAVIIAAHAEDDILYRMSFDTDMTLIGLSLAVT